KMMTGVNLAHVPYRGAGPALVDLLGGQGIRETCFPEKCRQNRSYRDVSFPASRLGKRRGSGWKAFPEPVLFRGSPQPGIMRQRAFVGAAGHRLANPLTVPLQPDILRCAPGP